VVSAEEAAEHLLAELRWNLGGALEPQFRFPNGLSASPLRGLVAVRVGVATLGAIAVWVTTASRTGTGAMGGAAAGAAIGSMSGNAGKGALIGAGVGALGGYVYDQQLVEPQRGLRPWRGSPSQQGHSSGRQRHWGQA
jgi:hypothetical protein